MNNRYVSSRMLLVTPCLSQEGGIEALSRAVHKSLLDADVQVFAVSLPSKNLRLIPYLFWLIFFHIRICFLSFGSSQILSMHPSLLRYLFPHYLAKNKVYCWVHGIDVWGALPFSVVSKLSTYHRLIASSHFTANTMSLLFPTLRHVPCSVINPTIVTPYQESYISYPKDLHILTVSRLSALHRYKGHLQILAALALLSDKSWHWSIVGSGDDMAYLDELISAYSLTSNVQLLGNVDHSQLKCLYQECSLFALPSCFSNPGLSSVTGEGFGIVYLEAAMAGKASIAASVGGHLDFVQDGVTGWLVQDEEPSSLCSIFQYLLDNPSELKSCGVRARERALNHFTYSHFSQKLIHTLALS